MPKLTKRVVDATNATDGVVLVWDSELRGFGMRAFPTGRKVYVVQYRTNEGRQRWLTLGQHGPLTPDGARDMARQALADAKKGGDPSDERRRARKEPTFSDLLDMYLKDHAEPNQTARTVAVNRRLIEKFVRPALGSLKVKAVSRQDVARLIVGLKDTPTQANHCLAIMSKAMNLAEEWGYRGINTNPAAKQRKYQMQARERFLSNDELGRLGAALLAAGTVGLPWVLEEKKPGAKHFAKPENRISPIDGTALTVIRVLLMSGARRSEIVELEWEHVDFERETLALPVRKGRTRRAAPVSSRVMAILSRIPRDEGSPWVFPRGLDPSRHISVSVIQAVWERVRRHAGLNDVHLHDLQLRPAIPYGSDGLFSLNGLELLCPESKSPNNDPVSLLDLIRATPMCIFP